VDTPVAPPPPPPAEEGGRLWKTGRRQDEPLPTCSMCETACKRDADGAPSCIAQSCAAGYVACPAACTSEEGNLDEACRDACFAMHNPCTDELTTNCCADTPAPPPPPEGGRKKSVKKFRQDEPQTCAACSAGCRVETDNTMVCLDGTCADAQATCVSACGEGSEECAQACVQAFRACDLAEVTTDCCRDRPVEEPMRMKRLLKKMKLKH